MNTVIRKLDIRAQIDLVSVPVFVVDQQRDGSFTIAAINRAHASLTGLDPLDVVGKTPHELLPSVASARAVVRNYRRAMETGEQVAYRETLPFGDRLLTFDTSLQRQMIGDRRRIIGTSVRVENTGDILADLHYYVALARNAVSTIAELTEGRATTNAMSLKACEATAILSRQALQSMSSLEASVARIGRAPGAGKSETLTSIKSVLLER